MKLKTPYELANAVLLRLGLTDEATKEDREAIASAFAKCDRAARLDERRICAAYALDRADQYDGDSACWSCLAEAAHGIANGEAATAEEHGEFDDDLYARVDSFKGKAPAVNPTDGVDP